MSHIRVTVDIMCVVPIIPPSVPDENLKHMARIVETALGEQWGDLSVTSVSATAEVVHDGLPTPPAP